MARPITIPVPHHLGQQVAFDRVKSLCDQIRTKYADQMTIEKETWANNRLDFRIKALKQTISGNVDVQEAVVNVVLQLPFLLLPMSGKATAIIERRLQAILQPM